MRRQLFVPVIAICLFLGLFAWAGVGEAASCYKNGSGVYVCDVRPSLPTFTAPRYPQDSIFFTTTYAWLEDFTPLYGAPSGDAPVLDRLDAGLLYSTIDGVARDEGGTLWYKVRRDYWAPETQVNVIEESQFSGVVINEPPGRPFGWILHPVRLSPVPGEYAPEDTPWTRRYTFVEIYDVVEDEEGKIWYRVGEDEWLKQVYVSLIDSRPRPEEVAEDEFWVEVDLFQQTLAAYEGDRMVYAGLVSTGLDSWNTNEGIFQVWAREIETHMYGGESGADWYFLEDVPHTMFFDKDIALHGAYWHDEFGKQRSHGCVNMPPRDAEWVFLWSENAPSDLWVWVHSSAPDYFLTEYGSSLGAGSYSNAVAAGLGR